jgi:hypothetical protein
MKAISILILMVGFAAHAKNPVADGTKGLGDAIKAGTRGGKAAIDAGAATSAKISADLASILAGIRTATTPVNVDAFRAALDNVQGLDSQAHNTLVKAFELAMVDNGCLDAHLTPDAYQNLARSMEKAVADLSIRNQNVNYLAQVSKFADLNGDGVTSPEEQKLSDEAESTLQRAANSVLTTFMSIMKKTRAQAVESWQHLAAKCGASPALAARMH